MKEGERMGALFYVLSFSWPLKGEKNKKKNDTIQMMSALN